MRSKIKSFGVEGNRLLTMSWVQKLFKSIRKKKVQLWPTADQIWDDSMSAQLVFQVCTWFSQALVSSVTGQAGTAESCHLPPPSNPSPPIIRSSPPSPPASRCREEQRQTVARAGTSLLTCAPSWSGTGSSCSLLCWTHTPRGPASKNPERGVSGWMDGQRDFLSLSSYSTAPVCTIIQSGLNPSSLHPTPFSLRPSIHPSLPLSLSHINSLWLSCPHLFAMALWPNVFPAFLPLLFFSTLILRTPSCSPHPLQN